MRRRSSSQTAKQLGAGLTLLALLLPLSLTTSLAAIPVRAAAEASPSTRRPASWLAPPSISHPDGLLALAVDLALSKTSDPVMVAAGGQVKYILTVANLGPSDAVNVRLTDTLPGGLSFETGPTTCELTSSEPDQVECDLGDMQPGATQSIELWAKVSPEARGNLLNSASVESDSSDPNLENNTASAYTYIEGVADLRITKFGQPDDEVRAGTPLTYTILVDNLGPSEAREVTLSDDVAASNSFELVSIDSSRAADCDPPGYYAAEHISCVLTDPLEPFGVDDTGRWMVTVVVSAAEPGSIHNVADVYGEDFDPDLSNNHAVVQHEISAVVDLRVEKTAAGDGLLNGEVIQLEGEWPYGMESLFPDLPIESWAAGGQSLTYTLAITNQGPSTAENIVLKDFVPDGLSLKGVTVDPASQGACLWGVAGDAAQPLTCYLGSLAGGGSTTVSVITQLDEDLPIGAALYNQAMVYNDLFDPLNVNNIDGLFTAVAPPIWEMFFPLIYQGP